MDKIKPVIDFVKRERFWVSCVLVLLVGAAFWWICSAGLRAEFEEHNSSITQSYSTGNQISSAQNHPNKSSEAAQKAKLDELKRSVEIAWNKQYSEQGEEIFVWPEGLGKEFISVVKPMRPIEIHAKFDPDKKEDQEEIDYGFRSDYANFIQSELPKLADIVDARWAPAQGMGMGVGSSMDEGATSPTYDPGMEGGTSAAAAEANRPMVEWSPTNQSEITFTRFDWSNRENRAPSSVELLYAQEDYWVLKSLLNIIKNTNSGATAYYNAAIRKIEFIQMGRNANANIGAITKVTEPTSPTAGDAETGYTDPAGSEFTEGSSGYPSDAEGTGDPSLAGVPVDPADKRYVNQEYQPLSAEELRESTNLDGETLAPEKAYLSVAKRMPIRMRVTIDGRKIPKFLTACANAELTVEVRQIRVNRPPGLSATTAGGGGVESFSGGYPPGGNMFEGGPGGAISSPFGSSATTMAAEGSGGMEMGPGGVGATRFPFDVDLEIYGIVYIYNPVARQQLVVEETAGAEEATPATAETEG